MERPQGLRCVETAPGTFGVVEERGEIGRQQGVQEEEDGNPSTGEDMTPRARPRNRSTARG